MRVGSLFSGVGGMCLGFERAGFEIAWQCEIDDFCRRVLAKHWPKVRRWDDVRTFPPDGDWSCDVICGGFPCKQTSLAAAVHGRRIGLDGADSGLWYEMLRIVRCIRPSRVVIENPPGVEAWEEEIKGCLASAGYSVAKVPYSAWRAGAPHLRRRVFFVADVDSSRLALTWQAGSSEIEGDPRGTADRNAWLSSLPGVLRVADGVPAGIHRRERIERLGNAVVPACAEWIAGRILAIDNAASPSQ